MNEKGEIITEDELLARLPKMGARLFIHTDAASYVAKLDARFRKRYPGTWNCRFITKEQNLVNVQGFIRPIREQVVCHYFGWKTTGAGSYHKILDPFIFLEKRLPKSMGEHYLSTLLAWGVGIRDFCAEQGIEVRCTAGAISGQFLTDPRFYPSARRKVPRATNDKAREVLPGNYYALTVIPRGDVEYAAYYLDQHSAHHYHASDIAFPDANELYAFGRFADVSECVFQDTWPDFYGLYCLDLKAPPPSWPNPPIWIRDWLDHAVGDDILAKRYIHSNELSFLRDFGYRVIGVRAAWGSHKQDKGMNRYAQWARGELEKDSSGWRKRLLLATYGVLAVTPTDSVSLYARASKGELASVRIGPDTFTGYRIKRQFRLEPRIANVLHRGMIEAACRAESINYAHWLTMSGYTVLSIYSDAVIVAVDDDLPIPLTPEPWRVKRTLTHLKFINTQAYQSAEETKIPGGVGREILKYIQQAPGHAPRPRKWHESEQTSTGD